jgi:hypothetical protein
MESVTLIESIFFEIKSTSEGGILSMNDFLEINIVNSKFLYIEAFANGGFIFLKSKRDNIPRKFNLENCSFFSVSSKEDGAIMYALATPLLIIKNASIWNSSAVNGGVYFFKNIGRATISENFVNFSSSIEKGGVFFIA